MGYQESWFYIEPQHKFKKLIQAYEKAEQSGYYEVAGAEPHSVIVLKQPFGDIPAGKKLLWVCGDRGFHCAAGVFGGELKCSGRLRVIPVEAVLNGTDDPRMEGLDFDSPAPSENAYMKITENDLYAKLRKEREELYKIIGKEEITDQKVRIDKYAHLYVLQDEMTEYLRARRLSQAEIEKLYAVENFYEYIQNYLLHHKDVFNYPYQKCADSILYPED